MASQDVNRGKCMSKLDDVINHWIYSYTPIQRTCRLRNATLPQEKVYCSVLSWTIHSLFMNVLLSLISCHRSRCHGLVVYLCGCWFSWSQVQTPLRHWFSQWAVTSMNTLQGIYWLIDGAQATLKGTWDWQIALGMPDVAPQLGQSAPFPPDQGWCKTTLLSTCSKDTLLHSAMFRWQK